MTASQRVLAVIALAIVAASAGAQSFFTARTIPFQNGNDGTTMASFQADITACVCQWLQPGSTYNATGNASFLAVSCALSNASGINFNISTEKCFADTNECDLTQTFSFQSPVGTSDASRWATNFSTAVDKSYAALLAACPYRVARIVIGGTMDRPVETTPVITGFVLALALGYAGFSVVLLISFCLVQRLVVGKD
jgi:hypothetical protein